MDDVCTLLLSSPDKKVDVLCSRLLRKVSDDAGKSVLNRFVFLAVEDAELIISARICNRAVVPGISLPYAVAPYPAELRVCGHYLPSPVVCSLYGILDNVRIDALILDIELEAFVLCDWLLDVVAVIGKPFAPIVRCLEYEPCGSAFVKK